MNSLTEWKWGETPSGQWVSFIDAEAEVEKARREARLQGIQEAGSIRLDREQAARADERERIVRELTAAREKAIDGKHSDTWLGGFGEAERIVRADRSPCDCGCIDRHFVSSTGICQCSCHDADVYHYGMAGVHPLDIDILKEPTHFTGFAVKPKPLEKLFFTDSEWDGQLYRKFNALVDAVNDLVRRLNEISPGNRP
jgi:hypothetical protein